MKKILHRHGVRVEGRGKEAQNRESSVRSLKQQRDNGQNKRNEKSKDRNNEASVRRQGKHNNAWHGTQRGWVECKSKTIETILAGQTLDWLRGGLWGACIVHCYSVTGSDNNSIVSTRRGVTAR
ncbi:hypothetical protein M8J77_021159 [Diaphorina citri]|nr:hypothetical protein M8J77_021159 [Diaphorina citri]